MGAGGADLTATSGKGALLFFSFGNMEEGGGLLCLPSLYVYTLVWWKEGGLLEGFLLVLVWPFFFLLLLAFLPPSIFTWFFFTHVTCYSYSPATH